MLIPLIAVAVAVGASGCTAASSDTAATTTTVGERAPAAVAEGGTDASGGAVVPTDVDRQIVTSGSATITVDDPADAAQRATSIVEHAGGRIDARHETAATDAAPGSADLTIRVPSAALSSTLAAIEALGALEDLSLTEDDVTGTTIDLAARITAGQASVDRLTQLLARASNTNDLVQLESALAQRQADLESMQAQQRSLADEVAYATVQVGFVAVENAPVAAPDTFVSGLGTGWTSFTGFLAGALVVLGVALPWLLGAAIVLAVIVAIVRLRTRRSATR